MNAYRFTALLASLFAAVVTGGLTWINQPPPAKPRPAAAIQPASEQATAAPDQQFAPVPSGPRGWIIRVQNCTGDAVQFQGWSHGVPRVLAPRYVQDASGQIQVVLDNPEPGVLAGAAYFDGGGVFPRPLHPGVTIRITPTMATVKFPGGFAWTTPGSDSFTANGLAGIDGTCEVVVTAIY